LHALKLKETKLFRQPADENSLHEGHISNCIRSRQLDALQVACVSSAAQVRFLRLVLKGKELSDNDQLLSDALHDHGACLALQRVHGTVCALHAQLASGCVFVVVVVYTPSSGISVLTACALDAQLARGCVYVAVAVYHIQLWTQRQQC
jgi:hypothetical protein